MQTTTIIPINLQIANAYIIKGERTILIDTGGAGKTVPILKILKKYDIRPKDISLILHTHGHTDHCGSTRELHQHLHAPSAIHYLDADMVRSGRNNLLVPTSICARFIRPFVNQPVQGFEPDILIDQEIALHDYGVAGRILFTPGHTPGSITLLTDDGKAIVGDLLMGGMLGGTLFPHQPRYHYFADSLTQVRSSIAKVLGYQPSDIYVGHGGKLDPIAIYKHFTKDDLPYSIKPLDNQVQ
ncbi:MAG: Glyoxylase or a related metal-dependent hydrolase, beta-lactamase superfamily II [Chloroflexi bacterium AL-W]|nr:Glyoxylase or a related metal-dependent hydrolase, beta-lactamase superfamily II [Chloroflexi bacterium AL-N1]NOK65970.1 Glyoxylase or a related metal-dependent hydrolase, beta-lactamase superfamily II [Chloroflexi bacterium AL-N10]NOK72851.1 Glyoxylase or a related metal-dependent hydrolase, beta-lactamase superfamily II [Chloroflexi bacterium AL-N5]NOK79748.1 Glyoxylase or a related metal-dependent hydrolase, beta-lactamase superfamily II [Chloroflexi bacterium AL-W]NOK88396.1 Glyoxylase o